MKPLFEVGEEVLLVSGKLPQFNGSYNISLRHILTDPYVCTTCGKKYSASSVSGFGYKLEGVDISCCTLWGERCLRKKHKPSEYDFNQLIEEVNNLVTV